MPATVNSTWLKLFGLAFALSFAFMAVSFSRVYLSYDFVFQGDKVLDSVIDVPLIGTKLGGQILYFVLAQILIYIAFAGAAVSFAALTEYSRPTPRNDRKTLVLGWFLLFATATFVANAYLFPWSTLGDYFGDVASFKVLGAPAGLWLLIGCAVPPAWVIGRAAARLFADSSRAHRAALAGALGVLTTSAGVGFLLEDAPASSATHKQGAPHVVLIGIDSLRPDFTRLGGNEEHAPNVNEFLRHATAFSDVVTPLARTFPSWMAILTGRHPHDIGALMNLTDRERIDAEPTLAHVYKARGYRTVFAIDEVRFANIDGHYGFDQVIAPPMGAADFLLGAMNDTPLSNLLAPTALGDLLFPHSHANRAAAHVYNPADFVERLKAELEFDQPTFLAVHFTLPHYPYHWAKAPRHDAGGAAHHGQSLYAETVRHADAQVGELLALLRTKGVLDNALVIFLSDHGEGLGEDEDVLLTEQTREVDGYRVPASASGHGTSVLSPPQYQVVLAVRGFGASPLAGAPARVIDAPASLEDVAPTLLDLTGAARPHARYSGRSLAGYLTGAWPPPEHELRIRFTETEFNPPALAAGFNAERELAKQSAKFYRVNPGSGLLELREETLAEAMAERQYAAIGDRYVLAALPSGTRDPNGAESPATFRYVLVAKDRSEVRIAGAAADFAQDSEERALWDALQVRFQLDDATAAVAVSAVAAQ